MDEASLIGTNLDDRYRLLEMIGDGGMGRVFRAEEIATGRTVALKLLHSQFSGVPDVVQRFEREAQVTTQLSHPHIVKTIEFGRWNERLYIAMEFLAGRSLADMIEAGRGKNGGRFAVRRTLTIMRPVLEALEYAHGLGVVHRDLKPENIMVTPARGFFSRENVKLLDFGIAKLEGDAEPQGQKLTQVGLLLGTPGYMSPEQAVGQKVDARSDIYSCGVILYEMLAGRPPFQGETVEVMAMHVTVTPRPLREAAGEASIPQLVEDVVKRALSKRPADRFPSARALREALDGVSDFRTADAIITGTEKTVFVSAPVPRRRARWFRPAIIALALALLVCEHLGPAAAVSKTWKTAVADARRDETKPKREHPKPPPAKTRAASKRHPARP